jgi:cytochrome P450
LLGHLPGFLYDKLGFLERAYATGAAAVPLQLDEPTLLLREPEDIRHVLTTHAARYEKTPRLTSESGRRISGAGLHTSLMANHLPERRLLQPVFRPAALEDFTAGMRNQTNSRMASWRVPGEWDAGAEMEQLALAIIIGAIFGSGYQDRDGQLARAITARRAFLEYRQASLLPQAEYLPVPTVWRYRAAMKVIEHEIEHGMVGDGFAARFAALRYPDGRTLSRKRLRDEILTLMSTGYETIGDALTWTLYLLARHPDVEAQVLREMAGPGGGLPYTRQVLEESLRLYPPTWIFIRMATAADQLPSGAAVRAGMKLYLCPYLLHRDSRFFPDPGRFDPERFTDAARQARPRYSYFPFGGGSRQCLGEPLAMQECLVVLSQILPRFRFHPPAQVPELSPGVTLRPKGGLVMRVEPR